MSVLVVCTESFAASVNGRTVIVGQGQQFASDHAVVALCPTRFATVAEAAPPAA